MWKPRSKLVSDASLLVRCFTAMCWSGRELVHRLFGVLLVISCVWCEGFEREGSFAYAHSATAPLHAAGISERGSSTAARRIVHDVVVEMSYRDFFEGLAGVAQTSTGAALRVINIADVFHADLPTEKLCRNYITSQLRSKAFQDTIKTGEALSFAYTPVFYEVFSVVSHIDNPITSVTEEELKYWLSIDAFMATGSALRRHQIVYVNKGSSARAKVSSMLSVPVIESSHCKGVDSYHGVFEACLSDHHAIGIIPLHHSVLTRAASAALMKCIPVASVRGNMYPLLHSRVNPLHPFVRTVALYEFSSHHPAGDEAEIAGGGPTVERHALRNVLLNSESLNHMELHGFFPVVRYPIQSAAERLLSSASSAERKDVLLSEVLNK